MKVVTIEAQAYQEIVSKLEEITLYIKQHSDTKKDVWVDNHDVCRYLKISTRTLQRLRSQGLVNFSIIRGKTYYLLSEVERMLDENLIKNNPEGFQELIANYYKDAR